jgi:hypothetical protein
MANKKDQTELSAYVPTEEYEFFRQQFPQYGASTWFINSCLAEFNARVREDPSAVEKIRKSIEAMVTLNRMNSVSA